MNRKGILILLGTVAMANLNVMHAQDLRERTYYYEILSPNHQEKPYVVGFAKERVKENLNRGLTAIPTIDSKGVYLSWRLLESDGDDVQRHRRGTYSPDSKSSIKHMRLYRSSSIY